MSEFTEKEKELIKVAAARTEARIQGGLNRVPLLGPLVGSFGLVALFYGMEKLLDRTSLGQHPIWAIVVGVVILLLTGAYYKKL